VTLFIVHVGWEVTSEILHHLMDGVEPEHLEAARRAASSVPEVGDVSVRGRWMGRSLTLEVEGHLPGDTSLTRAGEIGQTVEDAVREAVEEARHVSWIPRDRVPTSGDPGVATHLSEREMATVQTPADGR
jgi:divalent metal cation (Fe/Co/Zn/Cd) transporter